jgi:hypothetical protein
MKKSLLFITIATLLSSCLGRNVSDVDGLVAQQTIEIDCSEPQALSKLYEQLTDIRIIPLKTEQDLLINSPYKVKQYDGDFYFLDKQQWHRRLFCFTSDGELKYMIDKQGRGPGEYIGLTDYCISNGKLYLLDKMQLQINQYDIQDGRYLSTTSIKGVNDYQSLSILEDSLYVLGTKAIHDAMAVAYFGTNDCVHIFGQDGEKTESFLRMGKYYNMRMENYALDNIAYIRRDTLFMTMPYNNKIYAVTPEGVTVKYRFTFGDKSDIDEFIKANSELDDEEFDKQKGASNVHVLFPAFIEKDSYIISRVLSEDLGLFVWNKDSGETSYYIYLIPGWYSMMGVGNDIYDGEGDNLIGIISPHNAHNFINHDLSQIEGSNNVKEAQKQLLKLDIKEDDNPLIMVATLKN